MATPEQIAYRRILERKAAAAEKRRFENRCKYILGGILAKQLRVSSWRGLEEVRESLKESSNLAKIEWYLGQMGVMDNDSVPKIKKPDSFDRWLANEIKRVEVEELTKKIKAYLFRNRERIKLGLSRKILTFKTLAEKLSVELGCRVTAKKVQTVWYELLREEKKRTAEDTPDTDNQGKNSEDSAPEQTPADSQRADSKGSVDSPPEDNSQRENSEDSVQEQNTGDSDTPPPESKYQEQLDDDEIVLKRR